MRSIASWDPCKARKNHRRRYNDICTRYMNIFMYKNIHPRTTNLHMENQAGIILLRKIPEAEEKFNTNYWWIMCVCHIAFGSCSVTGKGPGCRMLRRQFSLDRPEVESVSIISEQSSTVGQHRSTPRLYKQNSAGAANDLERIEEVPATIPGPFLQNYRHAASVSLSVESLSLR